MSFRTIFIVFLAVAPASVFAVDTLAMEALLETLSSEDTGTIVDCDYALTAPTGYNLSKDFDFCQPQRQTSLMKNGLYVNKDGEIKPLPIPLKTHTSNTKIVVPLPNKEDVESQPNTPFVIDLTLSTSTPQTTNKLVATKPTVNAELTKSVQASATAAKVSAPHNTTVRFGCPDIQTFAHRGSADKPENSIEAIVHALQLGHNGVEIDVQQLKDGNWVVHHDLTPGRVSYGQNGLITNMQSHQWRQVRLKDRQGSETQTKAPFLDDMLIAFRKNAHASQLLNIEIKGGVKSYSCNDLEDLNKRVLRRLPQRQFVYSSRFIEHLTCLRTANPNAYLGVVVDPHQDSIYIPVESNLGRAVKMYDRFKGTSASEQIYVENSNRDYLTRSSFTDMRSLIGPYYGFHIDYHDYWAFAPKYSKAQGKLVLYQLDDDAGQVSLLNRIRQQKKKLPDGVLVDTNLKPYCGLRVAL